MSCTGITLILLEFIHSLPDEIHLLWPAPWSIPKALYYFVRYCTLLIIVATSLATFPPTLTVLQCRRLFILSGVACATVVFASEAILFVRVWAFSGRGRKMLVYLILQYFAVQGTLLVLVIKFVGGIYFIRYPFADMQFCRPLRGDNSLIGVAFALLLSSITVIMLIMAYLAHRRHRGLKSEILSVFYRDGVTYFICLSAMTSVNVFVNFAAPTDFQFLFLGLEVALHGILSTRMILHLRRADARGLGQDSFSGSGVQQQDGHRMSSLDFEPQVTNTSHPTSARTVEASP